MSIWSYNENDLDPLAVRSSAGCTDCRFCNSPMELLKRSSLGAHGLLGRRRERVRHNLEAAACPQCGWWWTIRSELAVEGPEPRRAKNGPRRNTIGRHSYSREGAAGVLKNLDLCDVRTPIEDVRQFLLAKEDSRFDVNPRLMEETVASVFRDQGYTARVTAYSGDGGIDVVLDGANGEVIGVQVKRYRDRIQVDQVRELVGALYLNGMTRGVFVTTSDFTAGAAPICDQAARRGIPVELVNGERFLDAIKASQRAMYKGVDEIESLLTNVRWAKLEQSRR